MAEQRFLIWSNQKRMWWRGEECGYTEIIDEAGRYDEPFARGIVAGSTVGGELVHYRTDPVTGREYEMLDEVLVLAPECISPAPVVDAAAVSRFRLAYGETFAAAMPADEGEQGYAGHRDAAIAAGLRAVLDGWAGRG